MYMDRLGNGSGLERGSARRSSLNELEKGHRQSVQHWNYFKGNSNEESFQSRVGVHNYGISRASKFHLGPMCPSNT